MIDEFLNSLYVSFLVCVPLIPFALLLAFLLFREWEKKRREERKQIVAANSAWYQQVLELNRDTKYYTDVFNGGHSFHYVGVNSKAKFDRTDPTDGFREFLHLERGKIERALEQVRRNSVINEVYCKKFHALHSAASQAQSRELGIKYQQFLELEQKIVQEAKLQIVCTYCISCYVTYTSPQGRNRYEKHLFFDEARIRSALKEIDRETAYQATEEYRRKSERTKVTPSLRYDVMRKDRFRCRLCGRSAQDGIELEVDHIVPIAKGGTTTYENLQTLCRDCNRGKGAKV